MQVLLFRALKDANIPEDTAGKVVEAVEERIGMRISEATKPLEGKLEGIKTSVDALRFYIQLLGSILAATAAGGVALGIYAQMIK